MRKYFFIILGLIGFAVLISQYVWSFPPQPIPTATSIGAEPSDADLTAIGALSGTTGYLKKTNTNTWSLDTGSYQPLDAQLTDVAAVDPSSTTGYSLQSNGVNLVLTAPDADLTAIAALAGTTGYLWKSAANTYALRTTLAELETDLGDIDIIDDSELAAYAEPKVTTGSLPDGSVVKDDLANAVKWVAQSASVADEGTLTPTTGSRVVEIALTPSDAISDITLADPGPGTYGAGCELRIANVGANDARWTTSSAVQEIPWGPVLQKPNEMLIFIRSAADDRWYLVSANVANVTFSSLTMGGLILGDSSPDAAGEIGYDGDVKFYNTAARTVATLDSEQTFTNKTLDANATGNVLKGYGYITLKAPNQIGAGMTAPTATSTDINYGMPTFVNSTDEATNWMQWFIEVPRDIDTDVDMVAWFKFRLGDTDTADHDYVISMVDIADSAAQAGTPANGINLSYTADGNGASGDIETAGGDTLTDWKSNAVAGTLWMIRLARDGDDGTNDASTVNSYPVELTIRYGWTQ